MQRLFIIRHGQSVDNAQKIIGGQRDVRLTELGKHQAVVAGADAKKLKIDLIVCSPLVRSRTTAEIIAEAIGYAPQKIEVMPDLVERAFGVLEGLPEGSGGSHAEVNTTVGVESLDHLQSRTAQVLRELAARKTHKNILIVCHFWLGRMLRVSAAGLPAEAVYDQEPLSNATIEELV